jgi:hypothetical protein
VRLSRPIIETVTMRFDVTKALQYLKDAGHEMSRAKYFRQKKKIENMALERITVSLKFLTKSNIWKRKTEWNWQRN